MYKITDILTGHYGHYANVFKLVLGCFLVFLGVLLVADAQLGADDLAGWVELEANGGLGAGKW